MEKIEYRTIDKSGWSRGEWDDEPDKMQWVDEQTSMPCLIVRNNGGALCGYVGVGRNHPLFGKDYNDCISPEKHEGPVDYHYECTPSGILEAHGGITFADGCHTATREGFEKMRASVQKHKDEATRFPVGDSARWLRDWLPMLGDFELFKRRVEATAVCHVGDDLEPVWWFGFDCAHCGDVSPAYGRFMSISDGDTYRNLAYVQEQCAGLARQLAEQCACPE